MCVCMGDAPTKDISHLSMRDRAGALTYKLLALDMDVRTPALSLVIR